MGDEEGRRHPDGSLPSFTTYLLMPLQGFEMPPPQQADHHLYDHQGGQVCYTIISLGEVIKTKEKRKGGGGKAMMTTTTSSTTTTTINRTALMEEASRLERRNFPKHEAMGERLVMEASRRGATLLLGE